MEFRDVVRLRRMVRQFDDRPIPDDTLTRILDSALHAPSAGFAQGLELIVLEREPSIAQFFGLIDPRGRKLADRKRPPVVVLPVADKTAYLRRYSEPDKVGLGMDVEQGWPVAYWDLDAAMAVMLMLLAAVDEGVGAWFFGLFHGEAAVKEWLGMPSGARPIGALALGFPEHTEVKRGSAVTRRRRSLDEIVHRDGW